MIAIVCIAFAAHVIAWLVLPESQKSPKGVAESVALSGAVQAVGA